MKIENTKPVKLTARRVKRMRKVTSTTQAEAAFALGVHPVTVSKIERGLLTPKLYGAHALTFRLSEKILESMYRAKAGAK